LEFGFVLIIIIKKRFGTMQKAMITTAAAGKQSNSLWTVGCS